MLEWGTALRNSLGETFAKLLTDELSVLNTGYIKVVESKVEVTLNAETLNTLSVDTTNNTMEPKLRAKIFSNEQVEELADAFYDYVSIKENVLSSLLDLKANGNKQQKVLYNDLGYVKFLDGAVRFEAQTNVSIVGNTSNGVLLTFSLTHKEVS